MFDTPAERLADIEAKGVRIDGWGEHQAEEEPLIFLDAIAESNFEENQEGRRFTFKLRYMDSNDVGQSIEWSEESSQYLERELISFTEEVKNVHLSDIHLIDTRVDTRAQKLSLRFSHNVSDLYIEDSELNELSFERPYYEGRLELSQVQLASVFMDELNIGMGSRLVDCEFYSVYPERLTQNSVIHGNELANATVVEFHDCELVGFYVEDFSETQDIPAFSYNWALYGGEYRGVKLPRSPNPQKYVFDSAEVNDFNFVRNAKQCTYSTLDVDMINCRSRGLSAPTSEAVSMNDGHTSMKIIGDRSSNAGNVKDAPIGHWNEIHVYKASLFPAPNNATCDTLVLVDTPTSAFSNSLSYNWNIDELPRIDPTSKLTSDKYLLALLNTVVTPDNIDAINRVSQGSEPAHPKAPKTKPKRT